MKRAATRKRKFHESPPTNISYESQASSFPLAVVIKSCSRIEELEISTFKDVMSDTIYRIDEEDLIHISQCKLLKKLTLGNFHISDGIFLEEVSSLIVHKLLITNKIMCTWF